MIGCQKGWTDFLKEAFEKLMEIHCSFLVIIYLAVNNSKIRVFIFTWIVSLIMKSNI